MIVIDTHVWIWLADESRRLTVAARRALDSSDEIGVSAISCFEVAMLVERKRIRLDRDVMIWIQQALALPKITLLSLSPEIAVLAARLDWDHRDPADRMIVASAMACRASLISKDDRIRAYRPVAAIW